MMEDDMTLLESAKAVLDQNWLGHATKPAPRLYPHQWSWDSAFIALALAIAFAAAAGVTRLLKGLRPLVFAAAGAVAMAVMLTLMEQVFFGIQMVAGARTLPGFLLQVGAGALAGLAYAVLTPGPVRR